MIALCILVFVGIALVGYLLTVYNGLVRVKAGVALAWSNIDVILAQRHDEIPKLVETCKQYMGYEQSTLQKVMQARASLDTARGRGDVYSIGNAEGVLRQGLSGLYAVAENYPDLKASDAFQHLQQRISGLETAIADRREVYNAAATTNNVRIQSFPEILIVSFGDFPSATLLHFQTQDRTNPDLSALFHSA